MNAAKMLPDGFLFVPEIKAIIKAFVEETEGNSQVQIDHLFHTIWTIRGFLDQGHE